MTVFRRNVTANVIGQAGAILLGLVTVPFYLNLLGDTGYGLVSFFLTLQTLVVLLDFGLSTAVAREVSMLHGPEARGELRDLLRTGEVTYFSVAFILYLATVAASGWLTRSWLDTPGLPDSVVQTSFWLAGGVIALRGPALLYAGFLRGQERQVVLNVVSIGASALRAVASILVLAFVSRSVLAFYGTQLAISLVEIPAMAWVSWTGVKGDTRAGFRTALLRRAWAFAADVGILSLMALVIKQADKIILSRLLPIDQLGYYNSAYLASNALTNVARPVQIAIFPRLTRLAAKGEHPDLPRTFHFASTLVVFSTAAPAAFLAFFSYDILLMWTRSAVLADSAHLALSLLSMAMMLNAGMVVPFALQLASGMTWLPLRNNTLWALAFPMLAFVLISKFGILGAASAWVGYNTVYLLTVPVFMFRHILRGHHLRWLFGDTLPFMALAIGTFGLASFSTSGLGLAGKALGAAAATVVYVAVSAATNRHLAGLARSVGARILG